MTDAYLRRIIVCACSACGAQPLHPCDTPEGKKLGTFCLIPKGQTPLHDWVLLGFHATELYEKSKAPIAMRLPCERCGTLHIDKGKFATHPHHTHTCQNKSCGLTWRPAKEHTVGVQFIPGFQDVGEPPILTPAEREFDEIWGKSVVALAGSGVLTSEGLGSQAHTVPAGTYRITAEVVSVKSGDQISVSVTPRPEPRPILPGSRWQYRDAWTGTVRLTHNPRVPITCGPDTGPAYEWDEPAFRLAFSWVRDP